MSINDPWLWSVDELVAKLCHSPALFTTAQQPAAHIPDGTALESELRARKITGQAFLTTFNAQQLVLENELKISHPSQRSALFAVIEMLRHRSNEYAQYKATIGLGPLYNNISEASPTIQTRESPPVAFSQRGTGRKRSRVERCPTEPLRQAPETHHAPDVFDRLMRWQNATENDDVIDFAAEESLEDDDDASGDDDEEDESTILHDPNDGQSSNRRKPTDEEIVDIINERIEFYSKSWTPNAGVLRGEEVVYDVDTMWNEAEASGQRQHLVQKYETNHAYYSDRLDELCDEVMKYGGSNADQVRQRCRNLETTIQSMELAGWLRDIYKLEPVVSSDDEPASPSSNAASDKSLSKSQALATVGIIDLDTPPGSPEVRETAQHVVAPAEDLSNLQRRASTTDSVLVDVDESPSSHQQRPSTPGLVAAQSIEPVINRHCAPLGSNGARITPVFRRYGDDPENASVSSVRRWRWQELIEHLDRKRIVSKTIFEMSTSDRESVRNRVQLIGKTSLLREIAACINMLRRGEPKIPGVLLRDMVKIVSFTSLFLSWWFCRNYVKEPNASTADLEELQSCIEDGSAETSTFYDYLRTIMETTFSEKALQHPDQPSQAEIIEISDDDA